MAFKTKAEKSAYKRGLFAGLYGKKKKDKGFSKKDNQSVLLSLAEDHRKSGLGAMLYNGKIYDVNHKGKPSLITKNEIDDMRIEYKMGSEYSDIEVAEQYTQHMRRKFGVFDKESGKWLGMLSENKKGW